MNAVITLISDKLINKEKRLFSLPGLLHFTKVSLSEIHTAPDIFASYTNRSGPRVCKITLSSSEVFKFSETFDDNPNANIEAQIRKKIGLETPFVDDHILVSYKIVSGNSNAVSGVVVHSETIDAIRSAAVAANIDIWDINIFDEQAECFLQIWKPSIWVRSEILMRHLFTNWRLSLFFSMIAFLAVCLSLLLPFETTPNVKQVSDIQIKDRKSLDAHQLALLATFVDNEQNNHAIIFDKSAGAQKVLIVGERYSGFMLKNISHRSVEILSPEGTVHELNMWNRAGQ